MKLGTQLTGDVATNFLRQPRCHEVIPKTGGFASPSFDGFALYEPELDSMGGAYTRTRCRTNSHLF